MHTPRMYKTPFARPIKKVYHNASYRPPTVDQVFNPFKLVGRNDQCPCESGKKYKRCHG